MHGHFSDSLIRRCLVLDTLLQDAVSDHGHHAVGDAPIVGGVVEDPVAVLRAGVGGGGGAGG